MIVENHVAPIYSYFTENHRSENATTMISEVSPELLRLSEIMFADYGRAENLPKSEIQFLAEVILQMGAHGIPGFDPRRITDEQYKIMYEAAYSLVHTVLRHPSMTMEDALQRPFSDSPEGIRKTETRRALLCVLNDRRRGVVVRLDFD